MLKSAYLPDPTFPDWSYFLSLLPQGCLSTNFQLCSSKNAPAMFPQKMHQTVHKVPSFLKLRRNTCPSRKKTAKSKHMLTSAYLHHLTFPDWSHFFLKKCTRRVHKLPIFLKLRRITYSSRKKTGKIEDYADVSVSG